MTTEELNNIVQRSEKAAFALGTTAGHLSGLLNTLQTKEMTQHEIYKELRDIWKQLGMQVNEIYYKDKEQ